MAYGRGHEQGTRKQKTSKSTWFYHLPETEVMMQALEAEWQQKQQSSTQERHAA